MKAFSSIAPAALLAAIALGSSSVAHAATVQGYVCSAEFDPRSSQYGSYGHVDFLVYSQPDCAGSNLGNYRLLTTGADATLHGIRYTSSQLMIMLDQLLRSAAEAGRVTFGYTGGGSGTGAFEVRFSR